MKPVVRLKLDLLKLKEKWRGITAAIDIQQIQPSSSKPIGTRKFSRGSAADPCAVTLKACRGRARETPPSCHAAGVSSPTDGTSRGGAVKRGSAAQTNQRPRRRTSSDAVKAATAAGSVGRSKSGANRKSATAQLSVGISRINMEWKEGRRRRRNETVDNAADGGRLSQPPRGDPPRRSSYQNPFEHLIGSSGT